MSPWRSASTAEWYRITEVPRPPDSQQTERTDDDGRSHVMAALLGAHSYGAALDVVWCRDGPGQPLQVLVAGSFLAPSVSEEGVTTILFPPGARCVRVDGDSVLSRLAAWAACEGRFDSFSQTKPDSPTLRSWGGLEEYFTFLGQTAVAWRVHADPIDADEAREALGRMAYQVARLRNLASPSEDKRVQAERTEALYRQYDQAVDAGLWSVTVSVGAANAAEARRLASILCNTRDLVALPWRLRAATDMKTEADAKATIDPDSAGAFSVPFVADAELLAAIARPPSVEMPGLRLAPPSRFDVAVEARTSGDAIIVGAVRDRALAAGEPLTIASKTLNRHTFVCGATGAGKSLTVRKMLEELSDQGIPWLVLEPAKAEYARMAGRLDDDDRVLVIRPGDPASLGVGLNPLEPEAGFPLQTHVDLVRALFLAAFDAEEPFPQVLARALADCYRRNGWDLVLSRTRSGRPARYPSLGDLQRSAQEVVNSIGYGAEVLGNVRGYIDVRLRSLRIGTPGRFFEGGHPLDVAQLLGRRVVVEIEDVGNDQDKAFLIGTVLIRLYEHLRLTAEPDQQLRHVTVVEEAHRLLRKPEGTGPAAHAVELFASMLAEVRSYGEGLIVAEQIPSKIIPDVIKNTACKIVHRLPSLDDRIAVGATMNLSDEQSAYVVSLRPGWAAVFTDGMDAPLLATIDGSGEARESRKKARTDAPLRGCRSVACGQECRVRPCTLAEIQTARLLVDHEPALALWAELALIGHTLGLSSATPSSKWLGRVGRADRRIVECAISHAVEDAIGPRYSALLDFYDPDRLAEHLCAVISNGFWPDEKWAVCLPGELEWLAGRSSIIDILEALQAPGGNHQAPHPDTERWADERGIDLPYATWEEQLAALQDHPIYLYPRQEELEMGGDQPGVLVAVLERLAPGGTFANQVRRAAAQVGMNPDEQSSLLSYFKTKGA